MCRRLRDRVRWFFCGFLCGLALLGLLSPRLAAADAPAKSLPRPNMLLIVVDGLGAMDVTGEGHPFLETPALNALARQSLRFTCAYSAGPTAATGWVGLLSGQWPARYASPIKLQPRLGAAHPRFIDSPETPALPAADLRGFSILTARGYACTFAGNWPWSVATGDSGPIPPPELTLVDEPNAALPDITPQLASTLSVGNSPWCLVVRVAGLQPPYEDDEELVSAFRDRRDPQRPVSNPAYAARLKQLDAQIGELLHTLVDGPGRGGETMVIVTSTHGGMCTHEGPGTPATSNAPLREGAGFLYDGGVRVPLWIRWNGQIPAGESRNQPVSTLDLWPTLLASVSSGTEVAAADRVVEFDGASLWPIVRDAGHSSDRTLFWHHPYDAGEMARPTAALRQGPWKFLRSLESGRCELFHVATDVSESGNRTAQDSDTVTRFVEELTAWQTAIAAAPLRRHPNWQPQTENSQGEVILAARDADVHGVTLRFEPQPHKNTLGYWADPADWAEWQFMIPRPGRYRVTILQGCGPGQGGSEVELRFPHDSLRFTVEATNGWQDFRERELGVIELTTAGEQTVQVRPQQKPGVAVMDLRELKLTRVE